LKRRRVWRLVALSLLSWAAPALAVEKLQAIGQTSLGWTDNVHSSPDEPPPDVPPRTADVFAVLSPSVLYARLTPSDAMTLKYTFAANLFFNEWQATSFANRVEWLAHTTPSRRTDLLLGASVTQEQPYTSPTFADVGTQTLRATIPSTRSYVVSSADETLSIDLGPFWRAWQGAAVGLQVPVNPAEIDDRPTTFLAGGRLGIEHVLRDDAFGPEVRSRYTLIRNAVGEGGAPLGNLAQVINEYVAIWRHDWGRYFTHRLEAGAVHLIPISREGVFWHPAGTAVLAYAREEGHAGIAYTHTVRPNLLLGQLVLIDEGRAYGGIPLDEDDDFWISGTLGYQKGRLIAPDGTLATEVDVALGDLGLSWQALDHLTLSARYQHITQVSGATLPPLPLSYDRNTVMLTATLKWPPDDEMPRRYRAPLRVDRTDELGAGEPELATPPGRQP
jgi:hypothetical protein